MGCSIRLIFSIADIQTAQEAQYEEEEAEEAEEGSEDEPATSYPIRCSISINKASCLRLHCYGRCRVLTCVCIV